MIRFLDVKDSGDSDRVYQSSDKPETTEKKTDEPSEPAGIEGDDDDLPF